MRFDAATEARLEQGKQYILDAFGADPNVTGTGIGYRQRGGRWTDQPSVVVMVARKRHAALVSRRRLLPKTIQVDGRTTQVDVVQAGPFRTGQLTPVRERGAAADIEPIVDRIRPIRPGCSISRGGPEKTAGTLGLFVYDNTDGTACLLSNNHVIADMSRGAIGDPIVQPGTYDGGVVTRDTIALLKRWVPIRASGTNVDAAIAQLTDQTLFDMRPARNLMPPLATNHPVVGIVTAGDGFGGCLLTRIDAALTALNVDLIVPAPDGSLVPSARLEGSAAAPMKGVVAPYPKMVIEKVGRTSGYTSAVIGAVRVAAKVDTPIGVILYTDLIWTTYFQLPGDSGSVVYRGGDGRTLVPPDYYPCPLMPVLEEYYWVVPFTAEEETADRVRDEFFAQSQLGRLLLRLPYLNETTVRNRLYGKWASRDEEIAAAEFYDKYREFMIDVLNDPNSPEVVTQEHLDDAAEVIQGLRQTVLFPEESQLARTLYDQALVPIKGMTRRQVRDYMNDWAVYDLVLAELEKVPTIEVFGAAELPRMPDPAAWWKLDGDTVDASGNGQMATLHGLTSWIGDGQVGGALRVGINGYAITAEPVVDLNASFTVAGWFRITQDLTVDSFFKAVAQGSTPDAGFQLGVHADRWWFHLPGASLPTESFVAASKGVWTHVAAVYNAAAKTIRLHLDGRWTSPASSVSDQTRTATGGVTIGAVILPSQITYWNGDIDDLRLYQQALTPAQIYDLVQQAGGPARLDRSSTPPRARHTGPDARRRLLDLLKIPRRRR
ncbi:LamG-like jellyroll fold domain-containing protein [[Actinomadura] parvosata]|uniref:LamG-like jellyroll fold domain-containing protein n=1 Tax=[Actinomadura] parvosata TaxID=1955412 RepID=UPI00406BF81B